MKRLLDKFPSFLAGVMAAILVGNVAAPALAALVGKTIQVYTGVDIYVDDVKLRPVDANGNPVEVFVYNGTTYLPVRAVGEAVGKVVQWEGKTNSVYLGKHTGEKPAVWLEDLEYFNEKIDGYFRQENDLKDNLGNSYAHVVVTGGTVCREYMTNGQYSAISGTLFQTEAGRSPAGADNSKIEIYGDGELLYSAEVERGSMPIDFYVDLTGVLKLEVSVYTRQNGYTSDYYGALANLGLWT